MSRSGDFSFAGGTCGATLAAHASCTLLVNFTPTATGGNLWCGDDDVPEYLRSGRGSAYGIGDSGGILTDLGTLGTELSDAGRLPLDRRRFLRHRFAP